MRVTFACKASTMGPGVYITSIQGKRMSPIMIYRSAELSKAQAVADALNSGLLGRITAAILKS